jgi:cholesterol transport system auxiliary component
MSPLLFRRRILSAAPYLVPLVGGCHVLPDPPPAQIYRLSPLTNERSKGRKLHKRLVVDIPTASESLDTDRIALIHDRTRFDYYANSLWTDRVPVLLQALLVQAFENDGRIAAVARDASTLTPDYVLETEIREFQARYPGASDRTPTVIVALALSLVRMPDHHMVEQTVMSDSAPAPSNTLDSIVETFDVVVGRVLMQSIAWTERAIGRG